jgi:hypothetical protein
MHVQSTPIPIPPMAKRIAAVTMLRDGTGRSTDGQNFSCDHPFGSIGIPYPTAKWQRCMSRPFRGPLRGPNPRNTRGTRCLLTEIATRALAEIDGKMRTRAYSLVLA